MNFAIRVVQPSNFLSIAAATLFHSEIKSAIESGAAVVVVDLKNITSMNSSSFIALVKALKLVRSSGCQLFLCSMNEQIRMLFELTGLDEAFRTFTDFDEFTQYMQRHSVTDVRRKARHDVDVVKVDTLKLAS